MSLISRKYCVFGCDRLVTFGVPVHRFPNPEKDPDLFMSWVTVIGKKLEESDPKAVYKSKRVCDHHFDPIYKISGNRLKPTSIPSINLYVIVMECPLTKLAGHMEDLKNLTEEAIDYFTNCMLPTCITFTDIDHCYSRPQRESLPPKPLIDVRKPGTRFNAGGTSTKKVRVKIDGKTCSAVETHQDSGIANAAPSEEPSAIDDDFAPPSPVPEAEGSETLFSWQQSELIPADDVEPLTAAELEEQTGISLYCDDTPAPQTVPQVPETSVKKVEYRCKDCGEIIDGFQFWCVQCFGCALCGACEARGEHKQHFVLRAPPHRPYRQTEVVLATIRHRLQNENLLTQLHTDDDGVKLEVKEESAEEDCSIVNVNTVPLGPDPLRHEPAPDEPHHTTAADETERPFKRPRLADYVERNFISKVKLASTPKPHENIRISSENVADEVEYVMEELKTAKRNPHENIRINDMDVPVEYVIEELETEGAKPHENIHINSDDESDQVEYLMDELETDDDTYVIEELETDDDTYVIEELETDDEFTEIEHLDDEFIDSVDPKLVDDVIDFRMNETDTIVVNETLVDNRTGAESILSDLPRRDLRRNIAYNKKSAMRGSPESMVRSLSSEAVVELRPLSSIEIRKWTADSKIRRK